MGSAVSRQTFGNYTESRSNNYDFLRFVLASLVVFAHGFHALNRSSQFYEPLLGLDRDQLQLGHLAVAGFFAISGFLVTASWERSTGLYDYLRKRSLRIYPGFVACWLICVLVIAPLSGLTWEEWRQQVNIPVWILKISLLRGFGGYYAFPHNAEHMLNTSLWTIPYEFGCYLLIAVIGGVGWLRRPKILIALTAFVYASVAFGAITEPHTFPTLSGGLWKVAHVAATLAGRREVCFFLMGATLYVVRNSVPFSSRLAWVSAGALAVAMRTPPLLECVLPLCFTYLLFYAAYHPRINLRDFGRRADLSYGIYLYGWPLQQLMTRFFEPWLNGFGLFFATMPVACGVAYCSWQLVEHPFLRLKQARAPARVTALAE